MIFKRIICLVAALMLGGCASMPYNDSFNCPQMENGKCTSVENAHGEAVAKNSGVTPPNDRPDKRPADFDKALRAYQEAAKQGDAKAMAAAEKDLQALYASSAADGQRAEQLDQIVTEEDTRLGFLGAYAQGQRMPGVRKPATLMETYILPYQTPSGMLAGERTLWIPVEDATWVWSDKFSGRSAGASIGTVQ